MLHLRFERKLIVIGAALFAACAVAAVALSPAASDEMRPLLQSLGIISCARTGPCQTYSNTSSGAGLEGASTAGNGLFGVTNKKSTSGSNGKAGVFGSDLSASGSFDSGVSGLSVRGTGVSGLSTGGVGVTGTSTNGSGISGISISGVGVVARSTNAQGLNVISTNEDGIRAFTSHNSGTSGSGRSGVFGQDITLEGGRLNAGVAGFSNFGYGVEGLSTSGIGVTAIGGTVVPVTGDIFPALGIVGNGSGGDFIDVCATQNPCDGNNAELSLLDLLNGKVSLLVIGNVTDEDTFSRSLSVDGAPYAGYGNIDINGTYLKNGSCVAGCVVATATKAGHAVTTYSSMVSQPTIEDFGEAQLVDGQASVRLEAKFANVIEQRANYLVFITPEGDANVLYVTQKSPSSFAVRESRGGRSTIAFGYRIVAKPFGSREARLPMVELPRLHSRSPKPGRHSIPRTFVR